MTEDINLSGGNQFEDWLLLNPQGRNKLLASYAHAACSEELDLNWKKTPFNRVALMNYLVKILGQGCAYLEIGCDKNDLFSALPVPNKVGVDPVSGGNRRMTSDAFFEQNEDDFDLIFLDGLHTYKQLRRDVKNALAVIRPGGFIGIHDLVPVNWLEEHVPRINGAWTGDVWKVGVELAETPGIAFRIVLIDHGVGLIRASDEPLPPLKDLSNTLRNERFADFHSRFPKLPTLSWTEALNWIEEPE